LRFKGFDLSVLFSWQRGAVKSDNLQYFVENPIGFLANGYNQSASLNFWKKPGDIATTPSPLYGTNFTSELLHDASFLRFRDVTLSYTLPSDIATKLRYISKARVYVQGSNLFIWTKWRGMDPEAGLQAWPRHRRRPTPGFPSTHGRSAATTASVRQRAVIGTSPLHHFLSLSLGPVPEF